MSVSHRSTVRLWFSVNCEVFCSIGGRRSWKVGMFHLLNRSEFRPRKISETLKINSDKNTIPTLYSTQKGMAERHAWLPVSYTVVWIFRQILRLPHQLSSEGSWGTWALTEQAFIRLTRLFIRWGISLMTLLCCEYLSGVFQNLPLQSVKYWVCQACKSAVTKGCQT